MWCIGIRIWRTWGIRWKIDVIIDNRWVIIINRAVIDVIKWIYGIK